jgi:hypothetical protein
MGTTFDVLLSQSINLQKHNDMASFQTIFDIHHNYQWGLDDLDNNRTDRNLFNK